MTDASADARWLGPIRIPAHTSAHAWRMAAVATPLTQGWRWWVSCVLAGAGPLALGWLLSTSWHQGLTALLLFFLLLAAVREERPWLGGLGLGLGFAAHSALAIGLAWSDPAGASAIMPDGEGYWNAQRLWITTGVDPEYDPWNWAPAHLHLLVGIVVLSFVSFGLAALAQGVYEVDLMNYYVGNLLARSSDPVTALLLGWHPWSVLRGLCYVVLVYEVASWSLQRFTGRTLASPDTRKRRWALGLGFFVADALVKIVMLDVVRDGLAANLLE